MERILKPTVYGWGVNDLKYVDDFYINNYEDYKGVYGKWTGMMKRAMSPKYLAKTRHMKAQVSVISGSTYLSSKIGL
jgi:hypothetical protein